MMAAVVVSSSAARTNCDYTVNNDDGDDVIRHDVALQPFCENLISNQILALNSGFLPPTELIRLAKHQYLDSILPLIDRA